MNKIKIFGEIQQ